MITADQLRYGENIPELAAQIGAASGWGAVVSLVKIAGPGNTRFFLAKFATPGCCWFYRLS